MLAVVACDQTQTDQLVDAPVVGTRSIIKRHGQEVFAEIASVSNNVVTTEFYYHGELLSVRNYYRGLFVIGGSEGNTRFELDFDETQVHGFFPLAIGKEVSFESSLKLIDRGVSSKSWKHLEVIKKTVMSLKGGDYEVFVIAITTHPEEGSDAKRRNDTVYYSPKLGMVLKSVTHSDGEQSFWRVVAVETPDQPATIPSRRRSGTLMI